MALTRCSVNPVKLIEPKSQVHKIQQMPSTLGSHAYPYWATVFTQRWSIFSICFWAASICVGRKIEQWLGSLICLFNKLILKTSPSLLGVRAKGNSKMPSPSARTWLQESLGTLSQPVLLFFSSLPDIFGSCWDFPFVLGASFFIDTGFSSLLLYTHTVRLESPMPTHKPDSLPSPAPE